MINKSIVIQKTGFVVFFIAWKKEVILNAI